MTPRILIHALGVPLRVGLLRRPPGSDRAGAAFRRGPYIGDPPNDGRAWAEIDCDGPVVVVMDESPRSWCYAIHEALHVMVGAHALEDEYEITAVEWAVCQSLAEPWRSAWREFFSESGFGWTERGVTRWDIGDTDSFLLSDEWQACVREAHARGWLHKGEPIWGMGVWPEWAAFLAAERQRDAME